MFILLNIWNKEQKLSLYTDLSIINYNTGSKVLVDIKIIELNIEQLNTM